LHRALQLHLRQLLRLRRVQKVQLLTRHYAPIEAAMPNETAGYEWKRETGEIESYKHDQTGGWLHIDPQSNFYDREAQPITREYALEHAGHPTLSVSEISQTQPIAKGTDGIDQGLSL
jgi:hypothetical protein